MLSPDGQHVTGWVTNNWVLQEIARQIHTTQAQITQAQLAADWALPDPAASLREPPTPLRGYQILEITIQAGSPGAGKRFGAITWPAGWTPASVVHNRAMRDPDPTVTLRPGDRIILLAREQEQDKTADLLPGQPDSTP